MRLDKRPKQAALLAALLAAVALGCVLLLIQVGPERAELIATTSHTSKALRTEQETIAKLTKEVKRRRQAAEYAAKQERRAKYEASHDKRLAMDFAEEKKAEVLKMHSALHSLAQEADAALADETGDKSDASSPSSAEAGSGAAKDRSADVASGHTVTETNTVLEHEVRTLKKELRSVGDVMRSQKRHLQSLTNFFTPKLDLGRPPITEEARCTSPDVWFNGECLMNPQNAKRPVFCVTQRGPDMWKCREWYKLLKRTQQAYEAALRRVSTFRYNEANEAAQRGRRLRRTNSGYRSPTAQFERKTPEQQAKINENYKRSGGGFRVNKKGEFVSTAEPDPEKVGKPEYDDKGRPIVPAMAQSHNPLIGAGKAGEEQHQYEVVPQRFPHRDGADLGDNYVSGFSDVHSKLEASALDDMFRSQKDEREHQAPFMRWANGRQPKASHWRPRHPLFARKNVRHRDRMRMHLHPRLRFFATNNGRMGQHSSLNPTVRRLVYGAVSKFMRGKYGYPSDTFPSTKQVYREQHPLAPKSVLHARDRSGFFPTNPKKRYVGRWRKSCESCRWRRVYEPRALGCDVSDCMNRIQAIAAGITPGPKGDTKDVKVCNSVTGCHMVTTKVPPEPSINDAIQQGEVGGKVDPFGLENALGDQVLPSWEVAGVRMHENFHNRVKSGEPVGDFLVAGWDGQNGVDLVDERHHSVPKAH